MKTIKYPITNILRTLSDLLHTFQPHKALTSQLPKLPRIIILESCKSATIYYRHSRIPIKSSRFRVSASSNGRDQLFTMHFDSLASYILAPPLHRITPRLKIASCARARGDNAAHWVSPSPSGAAAAAAARTYIIWYAARSGPSITIQWRPAAGDLAPQIIRRVARFTWRARTRLYIWQKRRGEYRRWCIDARVKFMDSYWLNGVYPRRCMGVWVRGFFGGWRFLRYSGETGDWNFTQIL